MSYGGDHPDKSRVAHHLAAGRVYLCMASPTYTVGSYPTLFTLARCSTQGRTPGSFVSVALSLRLPSVAVSNCLIPELPGLSSIPLGYRDQSIIWQDILYHNYVTLMLAKYLAAVHDILKENKDYYAKCPCRSL